MTRTWVEPEAAAAAAKATTMHIGILLSLPKVTATIEEQKIDLLLNVQEKVLKIDLAIHSNNGCFEH